jgi:hypothetical protein
MQAMQKILRGEKKMGVMEEFFEVPINGINLN